MENSRILITEDLRGENLLKEVAKDYRISVKRKITDERNKIREPYVKARKNIDQPISHRFDYTSPRYNKWHILTFMHGDYKLPRAITHHHCTVGIGWSGKKLYIIFRGVKTCKEINYGRNGGYIVTFSSRVLKQMREKNKETFGDIKDNDLLCEKIFTGPEVGVYYEFDWTEFVSPSTPVVSSIEAFEQRESVRRPDWMGKKDEKKIEETPIIFRSAAGIFLGFVTADRAEVRLKIYITYKDITQERLRLVVEDLLDNVYVMYNQDFFNEDQIKKSSASLEEYLGDDSINIYRLVI